MVMENRTLTFSRYARLWWLVLLADEILAMKWVFNMKLGNFLLSNETNVSKFYFQVGRGSETQLQVGENGKSYNLEGKGLIRCVIYINKICR